MHASLGKKCKHKLTGVKGTVTGYFERLEGTVLLQVTYVDETGFMHEEWWEQERTIIDVLPADEPPVAEAPPSA